MILFYWVESIYLLCYNVKEMIRMKKKNDKKKVMFIASTGGHLNELLQLAPMFNNYDYSIVTEKTKSNIGLRDKYKGRVHFIISGTYISKLDSLQYL